ncbi:hypothetical protein [Deinococcus sp. SL84]|uniref:hypothetical protein n=1 Tax=Deinococcus sp. SL84 TaxID=2994663 RepID=UPI002273EEA4|nr:hypothetical protein [Deinococcus sp. SL84]MCY1703814.1 hypothetical protein [Deinococcus sp. SL84]
MNAEQYKDIVYTYWLPAAITAGVLYVILSLVGASMSPAAGGLTPALMVLAGVVSFSQALGSLLVFPYLFTLISRRLGATTKFDEVLGVTAIATLPTLALLIISMFGTPGDGPVLLASVLSMGLFVYGLSQMNETPLLPTLGHTVAVWLLLILGAGVLSILLNVLI